MPSREQDTCVQNSQGLTNEELRRNRIRCLNDRFRKTGRGGQIVVTHGIQSMGDKAIEQIARTVMTFDRFDDANDPYGEHDMGSFQYEGNRCFWKIDYYDKSLQWGSPDATDPKMTIRVLTIMLASEY